jgi:hypothetical protein
MACAGAKAFVDILYIVVTPWHLVRRFRPAISRLAGYRAHAIVAARRARGRDCHFAHVAGDRPRSKPAGP